MAEKPTWTETNAYGPGITRTRCMEKADPSTDFQCPAVSGHGSGHSTKNQELGNQNPDPCSLFY